MIKSAFIGALIGTFAFHVLDALICKIHNSFFCEDEESFWENRQFEDSLEKADDLCEIGYTFQRHEVIYKKIQNVSLRASYSRENENCSRGTKKGSYRVTKLHCADEKG